MDYKELNEILSDLTSLRKGQKASVQVVKKIDEDEGEQGQSGLSYEIYNTPIDGVYVKLKIETDSYGDDERVTGIQFVKPVKKEITDFEPLNQ